MLLKVEAPRPARDADWPAIAALLEAEGLPRDGAREHLADFVVAEVDGRLVGVAGLECHGPVALLRSVVVAPDARDTGLARRLVTQLGEMAEARGVAALYLLTTSAEAYFARLGFRPIPRDRAPRALQASAEFQGACPASAVLMWRALPLPAATERARGAPADQAAGPRAPGR
ncbi:MAG: arsenic resistance N-acetyltransferase ArsN2 [Gammaproteobacteria bacterium]